MEIMITERNRLGKWSTYGLVIWVYDTQTALSGRNGHEQRNDSLRNQSDGIVLYFADGVLVILITWSSELDR